MRRRVQVPAANKNNGIKTETQSRAESVICVSRRYEVTDGKKIRTRFQSSYHFLMAEGEGFEPPDPCRSSVFKFYPAFVAYRLLLLFNSPNFRKISVLTALLFDNSGFLLCFGIVSHSLALLIFSAFLTAFCRDFVDE